MIELAPIELHHGEKYGRLTVIEKVKSYRGTQYRCGCSCGTSNNFFTARKLMSGKAKECHRCKDSLAEGDLAAQRRIYDGWAKA